MTRLVATSALGGLSALAGLAVHDLLQKDHALPRNFPVLGCAR